MLNTKSIEVESFLRTYFKYLTDRVEIKDSESKAVVDIKRKDIENILEEFGESLLSYYNNPNYTIYGTDNAKDFKIHIMDEDIEHLKHLVNLISKRPENFLSKAQMEDHSYVIYVRSRQHKIAINIFEFLECDGDFNKLLRDQYYLSLK